MNESIDLGIHWPHTAAAGQPVLRTMVVCDLSDSTALVERLGDRQAAALLRKHDRLTRALIDEHGGREIDKTDGYLLLFERPTQAVAFALAYHRGLRFMSEAEEVDVRARVGIHVGDVVMWENTPEDISRGAKPVEVEGLAKPIAARMASLAKPQQILLSGVAASIARRGHEEISEDCPEAQWRTHGIYHVRGVAEPMEVVQVGEPDVADFRTPKNRSVGRRILPWWRRGTTLSAAAVVATLAIGLTTWMIIRQPPKLDFAARDWAVIADVDNQTGQGEFGNPIDTALRIGLQQSRYVNVISTAKVQQTLSEMNRSRDTKLDAPIGAEVARRDNANALILPRVSYAGKEIVVSAQLIDPSTERVVRVLSSRAASADNIVAAIGKLADELRESLGESKAQVDNHSQPLAMVTTSNLEALRAYSMANQAATRGDYHLSQSLIEQALRLDPKFASAYATQAANFISLGLNNQAKEAISKAMQYKNRLSSLEQMKMLAQKATIFEPKTEATSAWKVLADLYPDDATGSNNVGLYFAAYLNDCKSALPYLRHAASLPQSKTQITNYAIGTCELATGHVNAAIRSLHRSYTEGFRGPFLALADAYVEDRQYSKAAAFLAAVPNDSNTLVSLSVRRALVVADQGDLDSAASNIMQGINTVTPNVTDAKAWALRLEQIGILWGEGRKAEALHHARRDTRVLLSLSDADISETPFDYPTLVLSFARWTAHLGDTDLAEKALERVSGRDQLRGYPVRSQLAAVTRAEIMLQRGNPDAAIRIAAAADYHPLWELLEVLARAKAAADKPDAGQAYQRLIDARPLAFGELYEDNLGICNRSVQWNIAVLEQALALRKTDPTAASRQASIFLDHWKLASPNNPYIKLAKSLIAPQARSGNGTMLP